MRDRTRTGGRLGRPHASEALTFTLFWTSELPDTHWLTHSECRNDKCVKIYIKKITHIEIIYYLWMRELLYWCVGFFKNWAWLEYLTCLNWWPLKKGNTRYHCMLYHWSISMHKSKYVTFYVVLIHHGQPKCCHDVIHISVIITPPSVRTCINMYWLILPYSGEPHFAVHLSIHHLVTISGALDVPDAQAIGSASDCCVWCSSTCI